MKKRSRNITIINNEIDYDKLAEAIVKAQQSNQTSKKNTGKFRGAAMNFFNGAIYSTVFIFAFFCICTVWSSSIVKENSALISRIIISIIFAFIGIYALLCWIESSKDNDSDAREHLNINISLIALIVAIIALFKGVG